MCELNRIKVGKFELKDAITIEELQACDKVPIITIEKLFESNGKIELDERKLKLFLNGVQLTVHEADGAYRIYNNKKFIGIGTNKGNLLKRDIVIC